MMQETPRARHRGPRAASRSVTRAARPVFLALAVASTAIAIIALLLAGRAAFGDDRELLRERGSDPYVFILLDTSGSMNRTPPCSAKDACEDLDPYDGACTFECPMEPDVCARVCPDIGCLNFSDVDLLPPIDIQIDDVGGTMTTGFWQSQSIGGAFGGSALTTTVASGATATFQHTFAESRAYKVFLHVPESNTWATNVPVDVVGTPDSETVIIDQRAPVVVVNPGDPPPPPYDPWLLIGAYEFDAGATGSFTIRANNTNGPVVVDAIRFVSEVKECLAGQEVNVCRQPICPNGDCEVPMFGDDPGSKFFQAKQALYEVLDQVQNVRFGFATFEQDVLQVFGKKWLHRTRALQIDPNPNDNVDPPAQTFFTLGATQFPQPGDLEVFGLTGADTGFLWLCPGGGSGCAFANPASLSIPAERAFIGGYPKIGEYLNRPTAIWVRETPASTDVYRVTYSAVSTSYGNDTFVANVKVDRCGDQSCSPPLQQLGTLPIAYDLASDFLGLDTRFANGIDHILWTENPPAGTPPDNIPQRYIPGCGHPTPDGPTGWDPNDDPGTASPNFFADYTIDKSANYSVRFPTTSDPRSNAGNKFAFDLGDVIPWDWLPAADHVAEVQARLAPNTADPLNTDRPDYRNARYFNDVPLAGDNPFHPFFRQLRLKDEDERGLIPRGFTPLGYSMDNIRRWFLEFSAEAGTVIGQNNGQNLTLDPDWSCRDKFVLMLTDGDDTCSFNGNGTLKAGAPNPSSVTDVLFDTHGVKTYVVGFGLPAADTQNLDCTRADDQLTCMAVNGGTEEALFPRNKDELVSTLTDIFGDVQADSRVFASASLPAVQSTAADKIFFSSFTPLPGEGKWPGRVDVFREPLINANEPPVCLSCVRDNLESGCHLYNVGDTILAQAPTDPQIDSDPPDGNVGATLDKRRVFYPPAYVPAHEDGRMPQPLALRLFDLPELATPTAADMAVIDDMAEVFVRPLDLPGMTTAQKGDALVDVYRETMRVQRSQVLADADPCPGETPIGVPPSYQPGDYLLGDVFHANPLVISSPSNIRYFRPNLCGVVGASGTNCPSFGAGQEEDALLRGYRDYTRRGRWFRRMLAVGTNDGQLHFFESGIRKVITDEGDLANPADDRDVEVFTDGTGIELFAYMPRLVMPIVREQTRPGATQIFSVDGSYTIGDVVIDPVFDPNPVPADREWRKVMIGGLREAGDRFDDIRPVAGFISGYYALDITQPDGLDVTDNDPLTVGDDEYVPDSAVESGKLASCMEVDSDGNLVASTRTGCASSTGERVPFPALKWEFTDRVYHFDTDGVPPDTSGWYQLDEDRDGLRDLADTWSKPLISQIRVDDGGPTTRWVAIFGGGIDPARKVQMDRGNWLYMVDIETGATLYKREVEGSIPTDITGLDPDEDGIIDVLYFTTTASFLYKVDLSQAAPIDPATIETNQIIGWPGLNDVSTSRITDVIWDPYKLFDGEGKPMHHPPGVVLVPELQQFALVFGTGDRENLWQFDSDPGRFIVMVDEDFERPIGPSPNLPLKEEDFITIDFDAPLVGVDANGQPLANAPNFVSGNHTLANGGDAAQGWIMRFPIEARVNSRAFVLSGVLVFTVFQPQFDPLLQGNQTLCRRSGLSRTFVVDIRNGDALTTLKDIRDPNVTRPGADGEGLVGGGGLGVGGAPDPTGGPAATGDCGDRCTEREGFGTSPFVSAVATKNPVTATQGPQQDPLDSPVMRRLIERLKQEFFPPGCEFNDAYGHMIRMQFDDTGVQNLVPVPVGVCPADWTQGTPTWSTD